MPSFQINQDMTYAESALVKNNTFLTMPAEDAAHRNRDLRKAD